MKSEKVKKRYYKGADNDAPLANDFTLLKEVWKEVLVPMWLIKKIMNVYLKTIEKYMSKGYHIYITHLGAIVPYRKDFNLPWSKGHDPNITRITYKFKLSPYLREKIKKATTRRANVQGSIGTGSS